MAIVVAYLLWFLVQKWEQGQAKEQHISITRLAEQLYDVSTEGGIQPNVQVTWQQKQYYLLPTSRMNLLGCWLVLTPAFKDQNKVSDTIKTIFIAGNFLTVANRSWLAMTLYLLRKSN